MSTHRPCLWVVGDDEPITLGLPPGTTAEFDPIRLVNENGVIIAFEGDPVIVELDRRPWSPADTVCELPDAPTVNARWMDPLH